MQKLRDIEESDSKKNFLTEVNIYNGEQKVRLYFKADTDQLDVVVYRYRYIFYLEDNEVYLQMTDYQTTCQKDFTHWVALPIFTACALYRTKQLFKNETNFVKNQYSFSNELLLIVLGI